MTQRCWTLTILLIAVSLRFTPDAQGIETVDLVILSGQSNAVGFDAMPSELPKDDIDKNVLFWWRCGDPPPDDHDSLGRQWTHLGPQPKGNPITPRKDRQYGNFSGDQGGFGPEISFARSVARTTDRRLAILKVAFSGTGIKRDWSTQPNAHGDCFESLCKEWEASKSEAAKADIVLAPRAFLWVQGESDANALDAPKYQQRLSDLLTAVREITARPDLPALIAVNTRFGLGNNAFMPQIVEAQKQLARADPHTVYVDTSSADTINAAHFSTTGTIAVGEMFAKSLLELETNQ